MMTFEQRTARAIQRASEQRAHVLSIPGRPGFFTVKSATDPAERYIVAAHRDGRVECSCKAASYGNPCWHAVKVENRLMREGREAA
jgi:hypothetical protein